MSLASDISEFAEGLLAGVETARQNLKSIVLKANAAVGSAEASILVPSLDETHLRFLVSLNEKIDGGDVEISREESFSGFVFNSGHTIAKVQPESVGSGKVDERSGVQTDFLLVVPIMINDCIIGVGSFVNRSEDAPNEGFMKREIEVAEQYADLYAVALMAHGQAVATYRKASQELLGLAESMGLDTSALDSLQLELPFARMCADNLVTLSQRLSEGHRAMWERFGEFLLSEQDENGFE